MRFEFTDQKLKFTDAENGNREFVVSRIRALETFTVRGMRIREGAIGGYLQSIDQVDPESNWWIAEDAIVCGEKSYISANSYIRGKAIVKNSSVCGSFVGDNAIIKDSRIDESYIIDGAYIVESAISRSGISNSKPNIQRSEIRCCTITTDGNITDSEVSYTDVRYFAEVKESTVQHSIVAGHSKVKCVVMTQSGVWDDVCVEGTANNKLPIFYTKLAGDAHITDPADFISIRGLGSENRVTDIHRCKDGTLQVACGCFMDTLQRFASKVSETHANNEKYRTEYDLLIALANYHFSNDATSENADEPVPNSQAVSVDEKYTMVPVTHDTANNAKSDTIKYRLLRLLAGGTKLFQIVANKDIPQHEVKAGDLGGYIESESNLCQFGSSWIDDTSIVLGNSRIGNLGYVSSNSYVDGSANISISNIVNSEVHGNMFISGSAILSSVVKGESVISNSVVSDTTAGRFDLYDVIFNNHHVMCKNDDDPESKSKIVAYSTNVNTPDCHDMIAVYYNESVNTNHIRCAFNGRMAVDGAVGSETRYVLAGRRIAD